MSDGGELKSSHCSRIIALIIDLSIVLIISIIIGLIITNTILQPH